jgi:hypothetical protein
MSIGSGDGLLSPLPSGLSKAPTMTTFTEPCPGRLLDTSAILAQVVGCAMKCGHKERRDDGAFRRLTVRALYLFEEGQLTLAQAARLADLSLEAFLGFLAEAGFHPCL